MKGGDQALDGVAVGGDDRRPLCGEGLGALGAGVTGQGPYTEAVCGIVEEGTDEEALDPRVVIIEPIGPSWLRRPLPL